MWVVSECNTVFNKHQLSWIAITSLLAVCTCSNVMSKPLLGLSTDSHNCASVYNIILCTLSNACQSSHNPKWNVYTKDALVLRWLRVTLLEICIIIIIVTYSGNRWDVGTAQYMPPPCILAWKAQNSLKKDVSVTLHYMGKIPTAGNISVCLLPHLQMLLDVSLPCNKTWLYHNIAT